MLQFINSLPGAVAQGLIWGIMAIGVYVTYRILDYADMTVDGSICTGGAVAAICITAGMNPYLALVFAVLAGMLAGLVTGVLHTVFGIPSILSGILTQLALYSINMRIMGLSSNVTISRTQFDLVLTSEVSTMALINAIGKGLFFVALVIGILYWFFGTELGSAIRATGNNSNMARAQGINTKKMQVLAIVISNGIVGLCGGLLAQYQGNADINMGRGAIVIGLAAIVIGQVVFSRVKNFAWRIAGTVFGAIAYYIVLTIVIWAGLSTHDLKLFSAIIVAIFLSIPHLKEKHMSKKKGGKKNA
ncbi:MAG: ABC transporter permease [Christensenellaceae bacterium]|nr:ABC transporter permease [Christensenellaceae bacterium]